MRHAFAVALALHALLHLIGFTKAFGLARVAQVKTPISRPRGLIWLAATALLLAAAVALSAASRWCWLFSGLGVVASQLALATAWRDARFGTLPNLLALFVCVFSAAAWGPFGLRAEYEAETTRRLARVPAAPPVTEAELAPLPAPVQRYLRYVGVVGHPHVRAFRVRFTGRIRSGPDAPWMDFTGEQHNFLDPATRFFWMQATMRGLPVDGLHAYDERGASMRVRLLSLFPVAGGSGPEFTRTETVTLFNDLCLMAPAALVDAKVVWRELDARTVEAAYPAGPHTVRATLRFDDEGALVDFWSDDRPALAPDGRTFVPQRWSTPVGGYRAQGPFRLPSRGAARYAAPTGEYAYIEFEDLAIVYDVGAPAGP